MKYKIELCARATGIQLLKLSDEELERLKNEDLDEIYYDFVEERDYEFTLERQYLTPDTDRFFFTITDENENVVCDYGDNVNLLLDKDLTEKRDENGDWVFDDDDNIIFIKGWSFKGIEDGNYLTRIQTIKGYASEADIELDEPFDESKLYVVKDEYLDDEFLDDFYPIYHIYYQRGEEPDLEKDRIELEFVSDMGEQYYETNILNVKKRNWWEKLK